MNSNTICLRIFFVLFILIVGGGEISLYAGKVVTPLAVCFLPTDKVEARLTSSGLLVVSENNSNQQLYRTAIAYADRTTILLTTSPPVPLAE